MKKIKILLIVFSCWALLMSSGCNLSCKICSVTSSVLNNWEVEEVTIIKEKIGTLNYKYIDEINDKHYYYFEDRYTLLEYLYSNQESYSMFEEYTNTYFTNNSIVIYPVIERDYFDYDLNNNSKGYRLNDEIYIKRINGYENEYTYDKEIYLTVIFEISGDVENHMGFDVGISNNKPIEYNNNNLSSIYNLLTNKLIISLFNLKEAKLFKGDNI